MAQIAPRRQSSASVDTTGIPAIPGRNSWATVEELPADSASKHGESDAFGLALQRWRHLRLLLAPGSGRNSALRGLIGNPVESICDAREFVGDLIGTPRAPQYDDPLAAEIHEREEKQA